jgi:hypothetical protein
VGDRPAASKNDIRVDTRQPIRPGGFGRPLLPGLVQFVPSLGFVAIGIKQPARIGVLDAVVEAQGVSAEHAGGSLGSCRQTRAMQS